LFTQFRARTRPARAGEVEGEDYRFLSDEEFNARAKSGEFLEHATVHGHHYGTLLKPIVEDLMNGRDVLIDIDTQGAANIRKHKTNLFGNHGDIFLMPPDVDELRRRLTKRGTETAEQIETRLANAIREMESWPQYRYNHHQPNHRGRLAEISTHYQCRAIFEPAVDPKVIVDLR